MVFFKPTTFFLQLVALWITLVSLAIITAISFITSTTCANCQSAFGDKDLSSHTGYYVTNRDAHWESPYSQTIPERIAALVHQHSSYFQSVHITLFQAVATLCLLLSAPSLWAMIWSRLDDPPAPAPASEPSSPPSLCNSKTRRMTVSQLQNSIDVAQSTGLGPAVLYMTRTQTVPHPVLFVVLVAALSGFAPLAISPIYKPHDGPYPVAATVSVGGGVGISEYGLSYTPNDIVPAGLEAGRALLGARSYLKSNIAPTVYDPSVAPFIFQDTIQAIWSARIKTVVARNTLDCGPSAPRRLWTLAQSNISQDMVTLDPRYFEPNTLYHYLNFSIAGYEFEAQLTNEPLITSTYLLTSLTNATGSVTAVTNVVFLAANGTFEGSQQTITSPEPSSNIRSVDVLICTSSTTLEVSYCNISRGNVICCSPSTTDDLGAYIVNPNTVATILSASPVTAYYHIGPLLPVYDITQEIISSPFPPLSYLTTTAQNDMYTITLDYTHNVLFGQTAQGIVQGLVDAFPVQQPQNLNITVTFGTSQPVLLFIIMGLALACGLAATLLNTPLRSVPALDTARLLAISRNQELDTVLEMYGDRNREMGEDVLKASVVCHYEGGRHVLGLSEVPMADESAGLIAGRIGSTSVSLGVNDYELCKMYSMTPLLRKGDAGYTDEPEEVEPGL